MTLGTNAIPNPGSDEAAMMGCKCARMDNGYGRGWMGGVKSPTTGSVMFCITVGCPLHAPPPSQDREPDSQRGAK